MRKDRFADNKSEENTNFPIENKTPDDQISKDNLANVTKNENEEENIHSKRSYDKKNLLEFDTAKNVKIYGKIAAGTPIEAIENPEGYVSIPSEMIKNTNQHYALKVSGESMIDAGILDGDIAVLEKTEYVKNGDIVVALIDSQEATLKRIRKKSNAIALEPANKNFETRIFGPKRVTIQGKLVGIIRNY